MIEVFDEYPFTDNYPQKESFKCLLLAEVRIAGFMFNDDPYSLMYELHAGDTMELVREPDNPFDEDAIKVLNRYGNKIGYIPRRYNPVIARLMDGGKEIYGILERVVNYSDEPDIIMMVLMREQC